MIARIWYGYTTPENADAYETLLRTEIFPGILARNVAGFRRIELLRGPVGEEVEFATSNVVRLDRVGEGFRRCRL